MCILEIKCHPKGHLMMKDYTGMRKGISLVEMMIAIVLFAALATIGMKYSKNFLNIDLMAMKGRVGAAMEQSSQLTTAYKLFTTQYGPLGTINDLNATATKIMTALPDRIVEMSLLGWDYNSSTGSGSGKGFTMKIDANQTATSDATYCALWNKEFNSSVETNVSGTENYGTISAPSSVAATAQSYCFGAAGGYTILVKLP